MKTWIVVACRTEAKVFEYANKQSSDVEFVTKLENPRGRLKAQEINADKPGVFSSVMSHGTRLVGPQSPTERVAQEFAKKISDFLEISRQQGAFDDLVLFADPHFLGRLRSAFTKKLRQCVSKEITKDLGAVTTEEIRIRLWPEPSASAPL
ncbi:host attachment protein [Bdellovibrio sp. BCCA]|uniref:host attachment protein n=1 Tax=unclassified Bdellovibrio TaxID=2633795 RepID=UPI0025D9DF79|nr:host attachment protein [uncultured Bdellovibrio sp.]